MKEYRLEEGDIFVFGSNEIGKHSRGASLTAKKFYGAKTGKQGAFGFFDSSFQRKTIK